MIRNLLVGLVVTLLCVPAIAAPADKPVLVASSKVAIARTTAGRVQGFARNGILTFRGIPYARAERFMAPAKVEPWTDLRPALSWGHTCPQPDPVLREPQTFFSDWRFWPASEDCLNLNVWTPALDGKRRPVMVWLHGGGFFSGSSMELPVYDGTNLARNGDVIIVSVNHRLTVLGFLDLSAYGPQYSRSANAGMLDIVAALEWVRQNAATFGGDPNNVTIFGQSGGGAKVATLMAAPSAMGLFHKAIIQSGAPGAFGPSALDESIARRVAELTLSNAGLKSAGELQRLPYERLIAAANEALVMAGAEMGRGTGPLGMPAVNWSPVVDGSFLPEAPFGTAAPSVSKGVPLLVGSTLSEFMNINPQLRGHDKWNEADLRGYLRKTYGDKADAILAAYRNAYPELSPAVWPTIDPMLRSAVQRTAALKAEQGDPVYTYLFAWRSPVLDYGWAAGHSSEIGFAFDNAEASEQSSGGGPAVERLARKMSQAWISFARTGDPNHKGLPTWPAFTPARPATMIFDEAPDVRVGHDAELVKLLGPAK